MTAAATLARLRGLVEGSLAANLAPEGCRVPSPLREAMSYSLMAGGKRVRPVLLLAAGNAVGGSEEEMLPFACAVEFVHTYSLIHDDLPAMDNDTMRRGKPTLHVVYGEGLAILAGDGLLAEAFALLAHEPDDRGRPEIAARKLTAIRRIAEAAGATGMVGGQAIDLQAVGHSRGADALDSEGLQDMHARKTGALIRAATAAGAIMAGADNGRVSVIDHYATWLGLAFQIVDDVLDVEGDGRDLGKTAGKDAAAGKPTYPALFGLEASKRMAQDAADAAVAALAEARLDRSRLAEIAQWVVSRTS